MSKLENYPTSVTTGRSGSMKRALEAYGQKPLTEINTVLPTEPASNENSAVPLITIKEKRRIILESGKITIAKVADTKTSVAQTWAEQLKEINENLEDQLSLTFNEIKSEQKRLDTKDLITKLNEVDKDFIHTLYARINKIQKDIKNVERYLANTTTKKQKSKK